MRGKIAIDTERCKGCEYCVMYCPKKCIELSRDLNVRVVRYAVFVDPTECTACSICARVCPDVCIEVFQKMGGPLYQKMESTISKFIDTSLDKIRGQGQPEKSKKPKER